MGSCFFCCTTGLLPYLLILPPTNTKTPIVTSISQGLVLSGPEHKALQVKTTEEYELGNDRTGEMSSTPGSTLHYCSDSPSPASNWKAAQHPFVSIGHMLNKTERLHGSKIGLQTKPNV